MPNTNPEVRDRISVRGANTSSTLMISPRRAPAFTTSPTMDDDDEYDDDDDDDDDEVDESDDDSRYQVVCVAGTNK